jgi:recombination protein RecA
MNPLRTTDNAQKTVQEAIARLDKQYGLGTVMRLDREALEPVESISSGSILLDKALGVGGLPKGRVVEIYGPEASGKTTVALHAIADCQRRGGIAAFVDAEHALDASYAVALGVNLEHLLVSQPDDGEQALDVVEGLVQSGGVDLVVVDSVAALVPRTELEGEMADQQVGLQARLMSKALRKLTSAASRTGTCVIFLNQLRQKIGVTFGPSEVTAGGNALKYYASVRLDIRRIGSLKKGTDVVGNRTRIKVVKNKLAPPFREVETDIIYGRGVSQAGELLDIAEEMGLLTRSGSWWSYEGASLGQGKEAARENLGQNPELVALLREAVLRSPASA